LKRAGDDVLLEFTDLQVTRGARLERAPRLAARLSFAPGTTRVARTTLQSDRVPFMPAEFIAALLSPQLDAKLRELPASWSATAGELRSVRFDSHAATFRAQLEGAELTRQADRARIGHLAATLELQGPDLKLAFDPTNAVMVWMPGGNEPRTLRLAGELAVSDMAAIPRLTFAGVELSSGDGKLGLDGDWGDGGFPAKPLALTATSIDRALLDDVWNLLALQQEVPRLADLQQGTIVAGQLQLLPAVGAGRRGVDWQRSRGTLTLANLSSVPDQGPQLTAGAGRLEFSRGNTQLRLDSGQLEDLQLTRARIDWPRQGAPRMQAALQGELQSTLLRRLFEGQGLDKLSGAVTLETDARGEQALNDPKTWRVTARISDAAIEFAADLPPVQQLAGTLRHAEGQLRAIALEGQWLGGPVRVESRRAVARGPLSANISGVAEAAPLLRLLGQPEAANLVNGQINWSGVLQRTDQHWQVSLNSNLAGVESRLPEPFDKNRARQLGLHAELRVDARGIREFDIETNEDAIHGRVNEGAVTASFDVQGVAGELHSGGTAAEPRLSLDRLELRRAPMVLAAAGALLPADTELTVRVAELRHANRGVGALLATLARRGTNTEFSLQAVEGSAHDLNGTGSCVADANRCSVEFSFDTRDLPALLAVSELPAEWPTHALRASGELAWPRDAAGDITRQLTGRFDLETQGAASTHQLLASATLAAGQIELANVQGTGPASDEVFRGAGRIGLLTRTYDLTLDFERISLAATAMPSPARAGFARAWSALRGSAASRGWTEVAPPRRVQWHGTWD
jgi:hypothetical protein